MRRPTKLQVFFAQDWPIRIWLAVGPVIALAVAIGTCEPATATFRNWQGVLLLVVILVVSPLLGYFAALLGAAFVIGPMYRAQARSNGAPFGEGDRVQVLAGKHRGTVTTVYSTFQGASVRVRLGATEAESCADVFGTTQLLREPAAEQCARP